MKNNKILILNFKTEQTKLRPSTPDSVQDLE